MDFSLVDLLVAVFATWRITSALNREKIGKYFRYKFAGERPDTVIPDHYSYADTFLSGLITCFWCLSFWVAAVCLVVLIVYPLFLYPFAISTLVIVLDEKAI